MKREMNIGIFRIAITGFLLFSAGAVLAQSQASGNGGKRGAREIVLELSRRYGELDGELSWLYASRFATVYKTLSAGQKVAFLRLQCKAAGAGVSRGSCSGLQRLETCGYGP